MGSRAILVTAASSSEPGLRGAMQEMDGQATFFTRRLANRIAVSLASSQKHAKVLELANPHKLVVPG